MLKTFLPVGIVLSIIAVFWYIMWKFAFEPNPLIRDFFDLDRKDNKNKLKKEK